MNPKSIELLSVAFPLLSTRKVSELKKRVAFPAILSALSFAFCLVPNPVLAQSITPAVDGTGSVVIQNGNRYNIQGGQLSKDGVNLFQSFERFGLNPNEVANFLTNPAVHNILGRVVGGDASVINGLIQVTGGNANLFLINPAGIIFGANAGLNVPAAFTATTANGIGFGSNWLNAIGSTDYANLVGTPNSFAFTMAQPGAIANFGNLSVAAGQSLTLLGGTLLNTGQITAPGGQITLAAVPGQKLVRLSQQGSLLSLEFQPIPLAGANAVPTNWKFPIASLPQLLTGGNLGSATGVTVNPNGTVQLTGSGVQIPTAAGTTIVSGQVSVASNTPATASINVLGDRVALLSANLNASGINGGTVRIGGDYQGKGTVPNAQAAFVSQDSTIQADALSNGNGGRVIVWADDTTRFLGSITAKGGAVGGNGGFVETSGKNTLNVSSARVNASAVNGLAGTWLLDPTNINIVLIGIGTLVGGVFDPPTSSTIAPATITTALDSGTSVTITTASGISGNGDITLTDSINQAGGGTASLTLTGRRFLNPFGATIGMSSTGGLTFNINQVNPEVAPLAGSIQNAIDAIGAVAGSRNINLGTGTYTLTNTVNINKSLTLNGAGATSAVVSGNNAVRVFSLSGIGTTATLNRLIIQNGNSASSGGGIAVNSGGNSLNLTNSIVSNNTTTNNGGGIAVSGGAVTLTNSTVSNNTAQSGGGGISTTLGSTLDLINSTISNNIAQAGGGGISASSTGDIVRLSSNSIVSGNVARGNLSGGGGINVFGTLNLTNTTILGNTAQSSGGGIFSGGAITLTNSNVSGNTTQQFGGGISNTGTLTLLNSTVSGNSASVGGGGLDLFRPSGISTATLTNSTVANNSAPDGGGIRVQNRTVTLDRTTLSGNTQAGVAINNAGTVTFTNQSSIIGGNTGVEVTGTGRVILGDTAFSQQTGNYITLMNGALANQVLDATTTSFDGVTGATANLSQLFAIENKIADFLDDAGVGFVRLKANNVFVTPLSGSIQRAVDVAAAGDTVNVAAGAYNVPAVADQVVITKNLTIQGEGASDTFVDGDGSSRIFRISGIGITVNLDGLTIQNGRVVDQNGGGILVDSDSTLNLSNSIVSNNSSVSTRMFGSFNGGGINNDGTLTVTNSTLSGNSADFGGGINNDGTLTVTNSTLSGNSADFGGGINNDGTLTVTNSTLSGNSATDDGGGIYNDGIITLNNSRVSSNSAGGGGGIFGSNSSNNSTVNSLNLVNTTIADNNATDLEIGGVIFQGSLTFSTASLVASGSDRLSSSSDLILSSSDDLTLSGIGSIDTDFGAVSLQASGDINLGVSIFTGGGAISLTGDKVFATGQLNTSTSAARGGELFVNAQTTIDLGEINTSSTSGNGGDVTLDPNGSIQVNTINAQGGAAGSGGNVNIVTAQFFRALGSFLDQNGVNASISTAGGTGGGAIAIRHAGGSFGIPFVVGNASANGTAGAITSGVSNQINPVQSFPNSFTQGNIQLITPGSQSSSTPQQLFREIQQPNPTPVARPTDRVAVVSVLDSVLTALETSITQQFITHLELTKQYKIQTLSDAQASLQKIATASGTRPALLYISFLPQVAQQNISGEDSKQPELARDPVTGDPAIQRVSGKAPDLELLLVTPTGDPILRRVTDTSRDEVTKIAKVFRNEVADPSKTRTRSYLKSSRQLYKWLIEPIEPALKAKNIQTIAFIMDTNLRFIPLAALHDGKQFLVEKYSIGLMPSLSLTDNRYGDVRKAQVLAAGASTFTDPNQNSLPAVQAELAAILAAKDRWRGESFLNDKFTLTNLKTDRQRPFGIIHLATHGEFLPGKISQSYIQLSNDKLRLNQIRDLGWNDLPAELVVLSACRMAVGSEDAELGFAGFAVKAGAKSALASLWNVSDEGTLGLMTEFYQELWQAPIKAEALRRAQIDMLSGKVNLQRGKLRWSNGELVLPPELTSLGDRNFSHPYYWSAFTIIGSPW